MNESSTNQEVRIIFREWELVVDKELTKQTYDNTSCGSAEGCTCDPCQNFIDNRHSLYPDEIKQLLSDLGIDYKKEPEVSYYGRLENGLHLYAGWFHFKGRFIGQDCTDPEGAGFIIRYHDINDCFGIGFREAFDLSFFDGREGLVQIDFDAKIPWTLDQSPEPD